MTRHQWIPVLLLMAATTLTPACKLDSFLFDTEPADLDDYDFTTEELDGISPERITSELIQSHWV